MSRLALLMSSVAATAMLAACGGGSSDSPPAPPPASGVTLSGVTLVTAQVEARCRGGSSGSTTSSANGSYSLNFSSGSLPCMLRATPAGGGTVLHSVAHGSGTAHITPATQLVVASFAGVAPAVYYSTFNDTAATALTTAHVQAAHAHVVSTLTAGGVNFSTVGNLLNGALTPASAHSLALDALGQRLFERSLSLAAFSDSVVRASPANITPTNNTASLPPQALLQPPSPTCNALRSGTYRVVVPEAAAAGEYSTELVTVNAATGVITDASGSNALTSTGTCSFTTANGGELVVSPAGVIVIRTMEAGGVRRLGLAFPEQAHTVAELAGAWQSLAFELNESGTYDPESVLTTVTAAGALTGISYCENISPCVPVDSGSINLSAHAGGGFNLINTTYNWTDRVFAYRAGNGDLMLAALSGNGSFSLWAPQRATGPLAAGARQLMWGVWASPALQVTSAFAVLDYTVTASDATTWTRVSALDGHSETSTANSPRNGWVSRPEGTVPTNTGGTVLVRGYQGLVLRGMGMTALSMPTLGGGAYYLSVNQ